MRLDSFGKDDQTGEVWAEWKKIIIEKNTRVSYIDARFIFRSRDFSGVQSIKLNKWIS